MTNRSGYETDVAAIAELFRKDEKAGQRVIKGYLRPRSTLVAPLARGDRRDHFWKIPVTSNGVMTQAMLDAARLVHQKLEGLSAPEFVDKYVGKAVAAVYCGCSESELDRRIRSSQTGGLEKLEEMGDSQTVGERREFRMSRVRKLKDVRVLASEGREPPVIEAATQDVAPTPSSVSAAPEPTAKISISAEVSKTKVSVTLEMALTDEVPWVEDKDGTNWGHLLIGALQSPAMAKILTEGGDIVRRTLRDALVRPWVSLEAREPWAHGYAALLAREVAASKVADSVAADRDLSNLPPAVAYDDDGRF